MTENEGSQKPKPDPKKPLVPGWDTPAKPEYIDKGNNTPFLDLRKKKKT